MFVKAPSDQLDFEWDWSIWLPTGDTISGVDWTVQSGPSIANLSAPTNLAANGSTSGGTLAANTYYYKVTALNQGGGETTVSNEASATTTGSTSSVALTWTAVPQAVTYHVYRGTSSNGENLRFTATISTNSFTDIGGATTSASPPGTNTAAMTSFASTNATVWITGGTAGNTYTVTSQVFTVGGRTAQWTQNLNVVNL
jgi:hypothetical protein